MNISKDWQILWWWQWLSPCRWEYPRCGDYRIFIGWCCGPIEVRHFTMNKRPAGTGGG